MDASHEGGKRCPSCGACKECGAKPQPQIMPMPYPVYPYHPPYGRPYTTWISTNASNALA